MQELHAFRAECSRRLAAIPVVAALLTARARLYRQIRHGSLVLHDYYGTAYPFVGEGGRDTRQGTDNATTPRAILAQVMQTNEQWMMEPVRQLCLSTQDTAYPVTCKLYMHDGASLSFRRASDAVPQLRKLQQAVRDRASAAPGRPVLTDLEFALAADKLAQLNARVK